MKRWQQENVNRPGQSNDDSWKRIWKLDVPPKVRVFWWRVIHEFLPAKHVLHKRHIELEAHCETCGASEESIKHVLSECTIARIFWEQTKDMTGVKLPFLHPDTWARDLLVMGTPRDPAVICCGMWSLWTLRNKRRHGELGWSVREAVFWVRDTASDLWEILHPVRPEEVQRKERFWEKPNAGWIKCNVDATFSPESKRGATGMVLRSDTRVFLGVQGIPYIHCMDAMTVEACACRDGMKLADKISVAKLCIESDCLELMRLWEIRHACRSTIVPILGEMSELSLRFSDFKLVFASRDCNKVAHEIAKQASSMTETVEWHLEAPSSIRSLLEYDCNHTV
ncbi:hypothetical protein HU200_062598 [Digitaria exilis]|uniref:Reverse transcriptase zinc-binding domain-containing protein n=1 Tax=Digitaria exilis TaxID=1010633 RepID=A0A835AFJ2_9POAL|nr:hypothetical protein HU200_062598 [Digitaria exilis]